MEALARVTLPHGHGYLSAASTRYQAHRLFMHTSALPRTPERSGRLHEAIASRGCSSPAAEAPRPHLLQLCTTAAQMIGCSHAAFRAQASGPLRPPGTLVHRVRDDASMDRAALWIRPPSHRVHGRIPRIGRHQTP